MAYFVLSNPDFFRPHLRLPGIWDHTHYNYIHIIRVFCIVQPCVSPINWTGEDLYPCSDGATSDEEGKKCASLRLDGKLTIQALAFPTQWRRRPDSFGGKVRDDQAFLQPCSVQRNLLQDAWQARGSPPDEDISCVELPIGDFQSWMLKLDMPFVYDSSDVNFQLKIAEADDSLLVERFEPVNGTVASFFARVFQAVTAFSFAGCVDPADIVCHETDCQLLAFYGT